MIKAIFSDLDNTLLFRGKISPANRRAVLDARAGGLHFVICSGRPRGFVQRLQHEIGFSDYAICYGGGGIIRPDGTYLFERHLPFGVFEQILGLYARDGAYFVVQCDQAMFISPGHPMDEAQAAIENGMPVLRREPIEILAAVKGGGMPVFKASIMRPSREAYLALEAQVLALGGVSVTSSGHNYFEAEPAGCGKGNALRMVAAELNIPIGQTLAMGDNQNDLAMLAAAGVAVCMGDGCDEAKAAAHLLCACCADDGAAQTIYRALRGEL